MSLYSRLTAVVENTTVLDVNIVNESQWLGDAVVSLTQDIYRVMEASDIADIVGEHQVLTEGAAVEVVLENIIKGGFEKLKAAFKKFWDKIKAFFTEVKKQIKLLFLKGEKFVKEFEKELSAKKAKGYKYMSHKYTFEKGVSACDASFDSVMAKIESILQVEAGKYADMNKTDSVKELVLSPIRSVGKDIEDNFEEAIIKNIKSGCTTTSELKLELEKEFRGGDEKSETQELEDFEGSSVSEMIKFIKEADKKITKIEQKEKKYDSTLSGIIKKIDNFSTTKDGSEGDAYKIANVMSSYLTTLLNIGKVPLDVQIAGIKEIAGAYESILKGYLRFKPAKEGTTEVEPTTESTSLFDSIYNSIC